MTGCQCQVETRMMYACSWGQMSVRDRPTRRTTEVAEVREVPESWAPHDPEVPRDLTYHPERLERVHVRSLGRVGALDVDVAQDLGAVGPEPVKRGLRGDRSIWWDAHCVPECAGARAVRQPVGEREAIQSQTAAPSCMLPSPCRTDSVHKRDQDLESPRPRKRKEGMSSQTVVTNCRALRFRFA